MLELIRRVHVEASSRCNSRCPMCSRYTATGHIQPRLSLEDLSTDIFFKLFTPQRTINISEVYFSGVYGDPCMNKNLPDFVDHLLNVGISPSIDTNGGFQKESWWEKLGAKKNIRINFSIDGLETTNHIYRRNVKWSRVWTNLNGYVRAGGKGSWTFIVFKHNEHQVEEAKRLAESLGLKFRLKKTQKFRGYQNWSVMENGKKIYDIHPPESAVYRHSNVGEGIHEPREDFFDFSRIYTRSSIFDEYKVSCPVQEREEVFLAASGHLLPCCYLGTIEHDSPGSYQFRNLFELDSVDLNKVTVEEALLALREIENTWSKKSIAEGKLLTCARTCGKSLNNRVNYV